MSEQTNNQQHTRRDFLKHSAGAAATAALAASVLRVPAAYAKADDTLKHLPVKRWVHPDEFAAWKVRGEAKGLGHVESGPLVRSSYHAEKQVRAHAAI